MKKIKTEHIVLLVIALFAAAALCVLSYLTVLQYSYDMGKNSIEVTNQEIIQELETSLQYGKKLDSFYGLSDVLSKGKTLLNNGTILTIESIDNQILALSEKSNSITINPNEYLQVSQDINDGTKVVGILKSYLPKVSITSSLKSTLFTTIACCAAVFLIILFIFLVILPKRNISKKKSIIIVICGILLQGALLTVIYVPVFVSSANDTVKGVGDYIQYSLIQMKEKGINIEDIDGIDEYLNEKASSYDWVDSITLEDSNDSTNISDKNRIVMKIDDKSIVLVAVSDNYILKQIIKMILTFLATIFIAVIFMVEFLYLPDIILFRKTDKFDTSCEEQYKNVAKSLRMSNFLTSTFSYMCLAFSALQIKEWNQGCFGLSPELSAALSISICSLTEAIAMIVFPYIARRMESKNILKISTVLLIAANFACFFTTSTLVIIVMRFFAGIGFAGNKQVSNTITVNAYSTYEERQANITECNNGIIGGILCGMGFGSIIAGVFGYGATFFGAAIGCIGYLVFNIFFVPWELVRKNGIIKKTRQSTLSLKSLKKILCSSSVWKSILLVVTPQYIFLMLIVSLIPGRIQSAGMDNVVLTYSNLLNGIFGVYIGVIIQKFLERYLNRVKILIIMYISGIVAMLIINGPMPIVMIFISAVLAGIIDGVGTPISTDLFIGNVVLQMEMEEDEILMLYSVIGCIAMSIAPIILELCEKSITWMVGSCAVLAVLSLCLWVTTNQKFKFKKS